MKIRCVIDGLTLHGLTLSPSERLQLERVLQAQLAEALRTGWAGAAADAHRPSPAQHMRIDLPRTPAPLGQALWRSLGAALSPAADAGSGNSAPGAARSR